MSGRRLIFLLDNQDDSSILLIAILWSSDEIFFGSFGEYDAIQC